MMRKEMNPNRKTAIIVGVLFITATVASLLSTGIAISLYPILRKYYEGLALGSVGFGLIEMVLAIWLIVKGFNPSAFASGSVKQI